MALILYSEGITVQQDSPRTSLTHKTTLLLNSERSYTTSVTLSPRIAAKRSYCTLRPSFRRSCGVSSDGAKSYSSSVSYQGHYECIVAEDSSEDIRSECHRDVELDLKLALVPEMFSETVSCFPKTGSVLQKVTLEHQSKRARRSYVAGVEIVKAQELVLPIIVGEEVSFYESAVKVW